MGTITHLPGIDGADEATRGTAVNHRMRQVTELVAGSGPGAGTWDGSLVDEVRTLFDSLAPDWTATRDHPTRNAPVLDALDRGGVDGRKVLELGAGTCISARDLAGRFDTFVAADLSWGMLSHAVDGSPPLVCTDGSSLPLADGVLDVLVLQNMFLFAAEVDRLDNWNIDGRVSFIKVDAGGAELDVVLGGDQLIQLVSSSGEHDQKHRAGRRNGYDAAAAIGK